MERASFSANLAVRFYSDRRLIALTLLLAIASGATSLLVLPRMEDPLLTQRAATITTVFPGADASRVEALVTEKIEDKLLDISEIKRMRSQSQAGSSFISIELRDEITDTDPVWSAIRGKLEDSISTLPPGAARPQFNELDIAAYAWIGAVVWLGDEPVADGVMRRLARQLKDELFAISGTKAVDLFGDPLEEIIVEIDADRAAAVGLAASAIAAQLAMGDVKTSAGVLHGQATEIVVELNNQFRTLEDILSTTLRSENPGQTLRLSDLATVRRSTPEPVASKAIIDGRPAVVVSVMLRPEYRIDQWADAARAVIAGFQQRMPTGVELEIVMQQDSYVNERMATLARNLLLGVIAVGIVTLLFMGWRNALLVTATLPVAALMVIAGMRFLGIPIHQMSITGLIIAMGLLIDNAIIAADEIDISFSRGFSAAAAVRDMVSRLFAPLLASTVTTALAFAPIALMEGPAGEFVGSIAVTVMLAIFSSFLLATTVLPATAAMFHRPAKSTSSVAHSAWQRGIAVPLVTRSYTRFLTLVVSRPWLGISLGLFLPICGFVAATQLNEQFFPPADRDQFYVELEMSPGSSLSRTEEVARSVDQLLLEQPRVEHTAWFLGESAPPFYYNIIARRKNSPNYAQAIVTLDNNANCLELIRDMQTRLDRSFPDARLLVRQLEQGPPFDAPVEIRLYGTDLERLQDLGEQLRAIATDIPDVLHVRTALSDFRPVAALEVESRQASWVGLSDADLAQQLFAQLEGVQAGSIIEEVEEIPVRVRVAGQKRRSIEDLHSAGLFVNSSVGRASEQENSQISQAIPVGSVASIELAPQRAVISRYNGRRINEVQAFITAGTLPSRVLKEFKARIASQAASLPPGFSIEDGGEASERDAAVDRLMANVSVLVVGMIASLVLALGSFRLMMLIGLVATLSIGLGMGSLWLFSYPFGFMAIIGTMGLMGIAINDSIVVVSALSADPEVRTGSVSATVERVLEVTRHVLATTATTVVGFFPLLLSGGGFWPPLAVAIGAGVTGATLISLTLVPAVIRLSHSRADQLHGRQVA